MIKVTCIKLPSINKYITLGGTYHIWEKDEWKLEVPFNRCGIIEVVNDIGLERYYNSDCFKTDAQIRNEKIEGVLCV